MAGAAAKTENRKEQEKAWIAVLMAWVAGSMDAIGYLALGHLFLAHMSGNSAAMGAHFGQLHWATALHRAFPIPLFVLGVALGAMLVEIGRRRGYRSPFALAYGMEALLLLLLLLCGNGLVRGGEVRAPLWKFYGLASLPAVAMGMQNATLRRVAGHGVRTTYVSGMLTNFAEEGVGYLYWIHDQTRGRSLWHRLRALHGSLQCESLRAMRLHGGIWTAFAAGAVLGGYTELHWALRSLSLPLAGLALIIATDLIQPFGVSPWNRTPAE